MMVKIVASNAVPRQLTATLLLVPISFQNLCLMICIVLGRLEVAVEDNNQTCHMPVTDFHGLRLLVQPSHSLFHFS